MFGGVVGSCGGFVVSLPSYGMGISDPHDFDLDPVVRVAVLSEVVLCFGSFQVGSDLLLDDGGGDGIVSDLAGFDKGVDGGLVAIYP